MTAENFKTRVTAAASKADVLIQEAGVLLEQIAPANLINQRQKLTDQMRLLEAFQAEVDDHRGDDGDEDPQKKKTAEEMEEHLNQKRNDDKVKDLHNMINELQEKIDKMKEVAEERAQAPGTKGGSERPDLEVPNVVRQKTKPRSNSYCQGDARGRSSTPVVQIGDESTNWWDPENRSAVNLGEVQGKQNGMDLKTIHTMLQQRRGHETPHPALPDNKEREIIMFGRLSELEANQASIKQDLRMIAEAILNKDEMKGQQNVVQPPASQEREQTKCIGFNPKTGRLDFQPSYVNTQQRNNLIPLEASANPVDLGAVMTEQLKSSLVSSLMVAVKRFDGEEHKYLEFMAQFDAIVHDNKFLSDAMKQSILFTLLTPKLSLEHSPTEYSTAGYYRLRDSLHRQFGRANSQLAIIMELMEELVFPEGDNKALSESLHTYATYANKLRPFGTNPDDPYFVKGFINKLPEKMALALNKKRARAGHNVTLESLMEEAHNFVEFEKIYKKKEVKEVYRTEIQTVRDQNQLGRYRKPATTANERAPRKGDMPPSKELPCKFCDDVNHSANKCPMPIEKKINAVHKKSLCSNCLSGTHAVTTCKSPFKCFYCQEKHYTGICFKYPMGQHERKVTEYLNQDDEDDESSDA